MFVQTIEWHSSGLPGPVVCKIIDIEQKKIYVALSHTYKTKFNNKFCIASQFWTKYKLWTF